MTKGSKDPCATFTPSANGPRKLCGVNLAATVNCGLLRLPARTGDPPIRFGVPPSGGGTIPLTGAWGVPYSPVRSGTASAKAALRTEEGGAQIQCSGVAIA